MTEASERQVLGAIVFGKDARLRSGLIGSMKTGMFTSFIRKAMLEAACEGFCSPALMAEWVKKAYGESAEVDLTRELIECDISFDCDLEPIDAARKTLICAFVEKRKMEVAAKMARGMSADGAYAELRDIMRADALSAREPPLSISELASREIQRQDDIQTGKTSSRSMPIGIPLFDINGGFFPGDLWTVAAQQGGGKTLLALQALNRAADRGARCLFLSLEMDPSGLVRRLLAGGGANRLRAGLPRADPLWPKIERRLGAFKGMDVSIGFAGGFSVDQLETEIRQHSIQQQVDIVAIDFFQLIRTPASERNESRALERICYALKFCAVDVGCSIILLSQLTKDSARDHRQARMSDLRGTSGLADASDVILTGFRPDSESVDVDWEVVKNRHGETRKFRTQLDGAAQKFRFD